MLGKPSCDRQIDRAQAACQLQIVEHVYGKTHGAYRYFKRLFSPAPPAYNPEDTSWLSQPASGPLARGLAARRGAAPRGMDRQSRMRYSRVSWGFPGAWASDHRFEGAEGGRLHTGMQGAKRGKTPPRCARHLSAHASVGVVEHEALLAKAGRGHGRWAGRQRAMAQHAGHHRLPGDGSHEVQEATAAQRAGRHIPIKDTTQQPTCTAPQSSTPDPSMLSDPSLRATSCNKGTRSIYLAL
jgi:hypothetical protein